MDQTRLSRDSDGIFLPLSDWVHIIAYVFFPALLLVGGVQLLGFFISESTFLIVLIVLSALLFLFMLGFYLQAFRTLKRAALSTSYFHFQPTIQDIFLYLIQQVYSVIIIGVVYSLVLNPLLHDPTRLWVYFGIGLGFSFIIQGLLVFRAMRSKGDLLRTAREPLKPEIIDYIIQRHPMSHLFSDFRFADIQPASLFLSAGVTSLGRKRICLVSRYFQWKLDDEELIAVLSHEEGHLANHHIRKNYVFGSFDTVLRTFRYFCVIYGVNLYTIAASRNETLLHDPLSLLVLASLSLFSFSASGCLTFYMSYKRFLDEIHADAYGARLVGAEILASTLRKLPSTIPSPIGYSQSSFLGFRIALLRKDPKVSPPPLTFPE
ncbi:MAG: M48 family metalloprotease [Candidatus Heimdallarchaeota archaeon]